MTIITAAHDGKKFAMACDTLHHDGWVNINSEFIQGPSKIIKYKDYLFGVAGYSVLATILEDVLKKHEHKEQLKASVSVDEIDLEFKFNSKISVFKFMRYFHKKLKEDYDYNPNYKNNDSPIESNGMLLLIVGPSGIYVTDPMGNVIQNKNFWAIGSGHQVALGAMHSYVNSRGGVVHVADAVSSGVSAACVFDDGCGGPIIVETGEE